MAPTGITGATAPVPGSELCTTVPDLMRMVESSLRAEPRVGGRAPYQP